MPCADRRSAARHDRTSRARRLPRARLSRLVADRRATRCGRRAQRGRGEPASRDSAQSRRQLVLSQSCARCRCELRRAHSDMRATCCGPAGRGPAKQRCTRAPSERRAGGGLELRSHARPRRLRNPRVITTRSIRRISATEAHHELEERMKIALLFDGPSALGKSADLAILETLEAIEAVLVADGHQVTRFPAQPDGRWVESMRRGKFELVFNMCEGLDGVAALEPAIISALEVLAV